MAARGSSNNGVAAAPTTALRHLRGLNRQSRVSEIGHCVGRHVLPVLIERQIERQADEGRIEIRADRIAAADLAARDQIRKWLHQGTIDSALQMTRSILQVRAFAQEIVLAASVSEKTNGVVVEELRMRCCRMFNSRPGIFSSPA